MRKLTSPKLSYIYVLALTLKDNTTDNKRTDKWQTKCQPFAKLKELQAATRANAFAAHLILPNRTQPHPPPYQRTMDNLTATFDINQNVNCNFDGFKLEK